MVICENILFYFHREDAGPAEATAEVHPPDIPDLSRDTSVERSSQEIPSVRQEESNIGNIILQTAPNSSFSSLNAPCQPKEKTDFKKSKVGRQLRSFQAAWFARYPWLHYDASKDAAFCFTCAKAYEIGATSASKLEPTFIMQGFRNWKKAWEKDCGFDKHEKSACHKEAVDRYVMAPSMGNAGEMLSAQYKKERIESRRIFLKILSCVRYLVRQSLPMSGNWSEKSGSEFTAKFNQLLLLRCEGDPEMAKWLERKRFRYTSPLVRNEMLEVLALGIMREITANIQTAGIYTIMADETADISNTEQLAVCFRWIDKNMEAHEDFVGLHPLSRTTADSIVQVLKDVLLRMNVDLKDSRGQCYDGPATMSGKASGVATQFKLENEKMLYTHGYGRALNLAIKDACDKVECLKEAFDSIREICKPVKKSPQRDTKLSEIRSATQNQDKSIYAFCPTRWTVRAETLRPVIENHDKLMALWEWSIKHLKDTEMKARVIGVNTVMSNFSFFYGCAVRESMLRLTDHLSRSLQDPKTSAAEGLEIAADTVRTLLKDRNEDSFDLF